MKESEIQCLKQEIRSLQEELQAANRVILIVLHFDLLNSAALIKCLGFLLACVFQHCKKLMNESSVSGVRCQSAGVKRSVETYGRQSQSSGE